MIVIGTLLGLLASLSGTGPNRLTPRPVTVAADTRPAVAQYGNPAEAARYRGRGNGNGNGNGNVGSGNGNGNSGNFNGNGNRSSGNGNFNATDGNGNYDDKLPRE